MLWRRGTAGSRSDIDHSVLLPLVAHSFSIQLIVALVRVTVSYRIIELDLPIVWLGLISGVFALLPIFLAVSVGRFIDRGNDARAAWIGSALVTLPTFGFYFTPGAPALLLVYALILGVGHLFIMASHQMLCVRAGGEKGRDTAFGNFTVAQALGQGMGPLVIGWIGGAASVPPTHFLFGLAESRRNRNSIDRIFPAAGSGQAQRYGRPACARPPAPEIRRFLPVLGASVISITASDLLTVYLPLLGAERHIDVGHIGSMLTVRSAATIASRMGYASMIRFVGRNRMTVGSMVVGGIGFFLLAAPAPIAGLYVACAILGFGLGIASTLSITAIVDLVPLSTRGTAMTLRITGNRLGQVLVPIAGSFVAAASGAAAVLGIIGLSLVLSGLAVRKTSAYPAKTDQR